MVEVSKGVTLDYKDGKVVLSAEIAPLALPVLQGLKAKVESGEIDPVKGTDIDKEVMLQALNFLISEVSK